MANIFDMMPRFSYSRDLHAHLKGLDITCNSYSAGTTIYGYVLMIMLIVSPIIMVNFYYGIFNRPKFANSWVWLLNVLIASAITFSCAFIQSSSDFKHNRYCSQLHFNTMDCILFGFTAATYTVFACLLISFIIKWKSLNNKKIPA